MISPILVVFQSLWKSRNIKKKYGLSSKTSCPLCLSYYDEILLKERWLKQEVIIRKWQVSSPENRKLAILCVRRRGRGIDVGGKKKKKHEWQCKKTRKNARELLLLNEKDRLLSVTVTFVSEQRTHTPTPSHLLRLMFCWQRRSQLHGKNVTSASVEALAPPPPLKI